LASDSARSAWCGALICACLVSLGTGCGGSGRNNAAPPWCEKPGIRYAGVTAPGVEVCFTLTSDARTWREIGYRFIRGKGCPGSPGPNYFPGPSVGSGPELVIEENFTARIRGARASGIIENSYFCKGKKFKWSAHATKPLTTQALRNLSPAPKNVCRKPGIQYVGRDAKGRVVVCFTLNSYRSSVIETGWSFGPLGCEGDVGGRSVDKTDLDAAGRFDNGIGLTGTIRGDRASGVLSDFAICLGKTFKWNASRRH